MNESNSPDGKLTNDGMVRVHEDVIASIVQRTIASIPEVKRVSRNGIYSSIVGLVGGEKAEHAISITMGETSVSVSVELVLEMGCFIPQVAATVQKQVMNAVNSIAGMPVDKVNVYVVDVEEESSVEEQQAKE